MYLDPDGDPTDLSVTGALAAAVPGSPAGLLEMHQRFGRLPFAQVIDPAIRLANEGYVVDQYRRESIGDEMSRLYLFPASRAQFLPNDQAPVVGSTLVQRDLGKTLERIRDKGAAGLGSGWLANTLGALATTDWGGMQAMPTPLAIRKFLDGRQDSLIGEQAHWNTEVMQALSGA